MSNLFSNLSLIGGVDILFVKDDLDYVCVCLVVFFFFEFEVCFSLIF